MRKFLSVLGMAVLMATSVCSVCEVSAGTIESRALMTYDMVATSVSGNITVNAMVKVNDGSQTIVGYSIVDIDVNPGVSGATVTSSAISSNGKTLAIEISYYYGGRMVVECISFEI